MNHQFEVSDAEKYGVECAIILSNLRFWIQKNKANNKHFYKGRYWTYNSAKAFSEIFPYWSPSQVSRYIKKLEDAGAILTDNFNQSAYDRTKWFALNDELDLTNKTIPFYEIVKSDTDNKPDINTDTGADAPSASRCLPEGFALFWQNYPKKAAKIDAEKAYRTAQIKTELADILRDIEKRKAGDEWKKDGGKYVPHPATYLRQRRWMDEDLETSQTSQFLGAI